MAQNNSRQSTAIYVGFLDDAREEMVNWKAGVSQERLVRPAFQKAGAAWSVVKPDSIPNHVFWTVGFDGKALGKIESRSSAATPSAVHLTFVQTITSPRSAIPTVGTPMTKYAPLGMEPTKGRRPLVLVSKPYVADPDEWTRIAQPPLEVESAARAAFKKDFPHVYRCKEEAVVERNWRFRDSSLRITSAYASNKHSFLLQLSLDAGDCGYVDDPNDWRADPWYFLPADGNPRRIGAFMSLLDAGDYDNDSRSEVIFMIEQPEDTEGFALFDAEMHKRASLLWTYH